ncbi:hypothetical protein BN946_scf185037.g13 [Trametes cinnabarina]|uniref:Uncharacterized protein n=1 Tax=Pycnoporus cinnabarinus TaxID=5643 RepID=A0A060SP80_PYCCI|nr:hypothetical protein BN946_scf185037.g13 [Trametes cinnabarina]
MPTKTLVNPAHGPGNTCLTFSRDGSRIYTGGADTLVRIWDAEKGEDQEPPCAMEANEEVTTIGAGTDCWLSGSKDSDVRKYEAGKPNFQGLVTNAAGIPIRCVAVDPKGKRVAVTSDEPKVKIIDLEDITQTVVLEGHSKAVRKATWHPSGSLLTTCGADGKVIVWDVSNTEGKQEKIIDGLLPVINDSDSPEFSYDCSAVWHTSGQHLYVATRTHDIAVISRSDWSKSWTLSDDACSGEITALTLSKNGVYLAAAARSGIFIWATQNRRMLFRYQGALTAPVTQMAFSPSKNLLAWTDTSGDLTRWPEPIPSSSLDPVKLSVGTNAVSVQVKRKGTPTLFDEDNIIPARPGMPKDAEDAALDDDIGIDLDNDDWILDDLGGGLEDDDGEAKRLAAEGGIKEMVSVTKAQPAFQPGSTPMENRKRYLAYNMIGVIEVTDQDTHHIVNVEFHDRSTRKSYHFTDHFRYDLASLGSQNLTGRLIKFDDFCILQKDALPIPKRHTLKWVGITEEGAPAMYDSSGVLHVVPRFRIPLSATWVRALDTNKLERRQGKDESYWPVGVAGDTFMCLILKGRQEHPGFPRPLIQELPIRFPFKRTDSKEGPLEEHFARESMLLDILRDGLGEELTTDAIAARELALDKELIQLIQQACKTDRLARALDLTRLLHLTPSFDMAIKVAGFYHLIGLQEKMEALKAEREADDRLENLRDRRRGLADDFAPVPAMRLPIAGEASRPKAFQDFRPPPPLHRPGLEKATPVADASSSASHRMPMDSQMTDDTTIYGGSFGDSTQDADLSYQSPGGRRKRPLDEEPLREDSPGVDSSAKRRALGDSTSAQKPIVQPARANPFARKPGADNNSRNPFARAADGHKSVHKSESFFTKVDAAEAEKGKRPVQSKPKAKKDAGKQTTLFGLPHPQSIDKKGPGRPKKRADTPSDGSQNISSAVTHAESQSDVQHSKESQGAGDTQVIEEPSQVPTEVESQECDTMDVEARLIAREFWLQTLTIRGIGTRNTY